MGKLVQSFITPPLAMPFVFSATHQMFKLCKLEVKKMTPAFLQLVSIVTVSMLAC